MAVRKSTILGLYEILVGKHWPNRKMGHLEWSYSLALPFFHHSLTSFSPNHPIQSLPYNLIDQTGRQIVLSQVKGERQITNHLWVLPLVSMAETIHIYSPLFTWKVCMDVLLGVQASSLNAQRTYKLKRRKERKNGNEGRRPKPIPETEATSLDTQLLVNSS